MKHLSTLLCLIYLSACIFARAPARACQVTADVVLQDIPAHIPEMAAQQYTIAADEVLPIVETVWIPELQANYVQVQYGMVDGWLPVQNCKVVTR